MTSLTTALPLTQGISNQISFLVVEFFLSNTWMSQVFSNAQYAYPKIKNDLASKQRPSIFCYPKNDTKVGFDVSENGIIILELHFSFQQERTYLAQNMVQIANLIKLINLNEEITQYAQDFMPGLFWIGKSFKTDYTKAFSSESVIIMELDYRIDLLAYQEGLLLQGKDITSPDERIYQTALYLQEQIALLDANLEPVIVTPPIIE